MLARYMLSYTDGVYAVVVCLSVCRPSPTSIVSKRLDESSWFLACRHFHLPYAVFKEIRVTSKNKGTSIWDFAPHSGLEKFRHGKSIALSTKLVDGRAC